MGTNPPAASEMRIPEGEEGRRVDRVIRRHFPRSSLSEIYRLLRTGRVRLNGRKCRPADRVRKGDRLTLPSVLLSGRAHEAAPPATRVDIRVVHEDADILIVDKPGDLVVHPGSRHVSNTLVGQVALHLRRAGRPAAVHLVHRLDRNTSGLLVLGRSPRIARALAEMFRAGEVEKEYIALVAGRPPASGEISAPLMKEERPAGPRVRPSGGGRPAWTSYRRLATRQGLSLLRVRIRTGRTHQIRAHLRHIGHPIVGDPRYGDGRRNRSVRDRCGLGRQFLHASRLRFRHPTREVPIDRGAPLPDDLAAPLRALGMREPS